MRPLTRLRRLRRRPSKRLFVAVQEGGLRAAFFLVRPAGRTHLEVQVLYSPSKEELAERQGFRGKLRV